MQKQYLLLRNNQQSGPHSLHELLQMNLKASDLVWIEGKSHAWSFPHEIDELKTTVPAPDRPASTQGAPIQPTPHIYVSLPKKDTHREVSYDSLEDRAEALRRKVESMAGREEPAPELNTLYSRSMDDVSESYGAWLTAKKKRGIVLHSGFLMPALLIATVLVGGWWMGKIIFSSQTFTLSQQKAVATNETQGRPTHENATLSSTVSVAQPATTESADTSMPKVSTVQKPPQLTVSLPQQETTFVEKPVEPVAVTAMPQTPSTQQKPEKPEEKKEETAVSEPEVKANPEAKDEDQKKGIGKFFAGIFGKKKKEEAEGAVATVDLKSQVEVRLKENPDQWMMGVQGAKLVVNNRSDTEVKTAAVEVTYLSEDKEVIERKVIQVGTIKKNKSKTIAVPDHRTANHVSYKLLSATGEEWLAKQ